MESFDNFCAPQINAEAGQRPRKRGDLPSGWWLLPVLGASLVFWFWIGWQIIA